MLLQLIIFLIVFFFYLHILYQLKVSNDLEVYEIDMISKKKLDELCYIKQPIVIKHDNNNIFNNFNYDNIDENFNTYDINVRDICNNTLIYYSTLFKKINKNIMISDNNSKFLNDTKLENIIKELDGLLLPKSTVNKKYDMIIGNNYNLPLKYNIYERNFYYVTDGEVDIKLCAPENIDNLYIDKDYEFFEFRSLINPWRVQPEYKNTFTKLKFIDMKLKKGDLIYIPPQWFYSIDFKTRAVLVSLNYTTFMNFVTILPEYMLQLLQQQNINEKFSSTIIKM